MSLLDLIVEKRPEILRIAAKHGARNLRLFGSVARGEERETSDVDLLAEVEDYHGQLGLIGELYQLLGVEVDVVADPPLPQFRDRILGEAIPLDAPDFREQAVLQSQRPHDPLERDYERCRSMLSRCEEAISMAAETTRNAFLTQPMPQYALIKVLELIGEYATRISDDFKDAHPEVPWNPMIGFRNRAVHDYERLDLASIWDETIQVSLPELKAQLEKLL